MRERLEPGGDISLEWVVRPLVRGEARVELGAVGSLFPFGFLKKHLGIALRRTVLVWPAQIDFQIFRGGGALAGSSGQQSRRIGSGDDLLALRKYDQGDSHRLIHWKASARLGRLMIRQFATETHDGFVLSVESGSMQNPEQFELLCSFAASLAEDLFAEGRLLGVVINSDPLIETRSMRDVEEFLDQLALLQFGAQQQKTFTPIEPGNNLVTFIAEGTRTVAAYVDGIKIAST